MNKLFTPFRAGCLSLGHRVVMAPLTRMRSNRGDLPNALMVEYYAQRASEGGLIISEATPISRQGYGYAGAPGIYDDSQIDGWRKVTDAVHARGGKIVMQLWHVGRQSATALQPDGAAPVAPSAIMAEGYGYAESGPVPFTMPRALDRHEIPAIIAEFRAGAARAKVAGFDVSRFMAPTVICQTNSCRMAPTSAPMTTVGPSRTVRASSRSDTIRH